MKQNQKLPTPKNVEFLLLSYKMQLLNFFLASRHRVTHVHSIKFQQE